MNEINELYSRHRLLLLAVLVSLALKIVYLTHPEIVNRDGALYIAAARQFANGNAAAALALQLRLLLGENGDVNNFSARVTSTTQWGHSCSNVHCQHLRMAQTGRIAIRPYIYHFISFGCHRLRGQGMSSHFRALPSSP